MIKTFLYVAALVGAYMFGAYTECATRAYHVSQVTRNPYLSVLDPIGRLRAKYGLGTAALRIDKHSGTETEETQN